jgi:hypothetical protein
LPFDFNRQGEIRQVDIGDQAAAIDVVAEVLLLENSVSLASQEFGNALL